jgi:GNAT superfamily N-acetyltransferase
LVLSELILRKEQHISDGCKPDSQNKGIGTKLMQAIEEYFRMAAHYELFTGHRSARNLYLYQKLGYREFKRLPVNDWIILVFLIDGNLSLSDT